MRRGSFLGLLVIAVIVIVIFSLYRESTPSADSYSKLINSKRLETFETLRDGRDSPFRGDTTFNGLSYYNPDLSYRINARLEPVEIPEKLTLPTNDGKERIYNKFGYAVFRFENETHRLLVLQMEPPFQGKLFIPFADATSAIDTYGGGRYLEPDKVSGQTILLDFNLAYNPYCAYNETFSCPIPPAENLLTIAIRAGEKNYEPLPATRVENQ